MKEPTRRDILKTGGAALAAGLAGCSDDENPESSAQPQVGGSVSETTPSEILDDIIDPDELYNSDIIDTDKIEQSSIPVYFRRYYPQKVQQLLPEDMNLADIDQVTGLHAEDMLTLTEQPFGVYTGTYDANEDEIVSNLEQEGFESYNSSIDASGWDLYKGQSIETGHGMANIVTAVNDNAAIFAPVYEDPPSSDALGYKLVTDPEKAIEVALDTYSGELEAAPEGDDYNDETASTMKEFLEEEDLGELEDAPDNYGSLIVSDNPENSDYSFAGAFKMVKTDWDEREKHRGALTVNPDHSTEYKEDTKSF